MLRAFIPPAMPAYRPLPSRPAAPEAASPGTLVHEAQLSCSYIHPGGKKPERGVANRESRLRFTLEQSSDARTWLPTPRTQLLGRLLHVLKLHFPGHATLWKFSIEKAASEAAGEVTPSAARLPLCC